MFALRVRAAVCSALLFCAAIAAAGEIETIAVPGLGNVPYQQLFTATSEPGETLDAFAARIAPRLRAYTKETGFEAGGVLATDGERFGVVIGSTEGHTACILSSRFMPDGMKPTGESIHSHTTMERYRATRTDLLVLGVGYRLGQSVKGDNPDRFSDEDFRAPGYMVSGRAVWHQAGRLNVRKVADFKDPARLGST